MSTIERTCLPAVVTKSTHSRIPNDEIFFTPPRSSTSVSPATVAPSFFPSKPSSIVPANLRHAIAPSANFSIVSFGPASPVGLGAGGRLGVWETASMA